MVALDFSNHFGTTMCGILSFDLIQVDGHIFSIGLKILAKTPPKMEVYQIYQDDMFFSAEGDAKKNNVRLKTSFPFGMA